MKPVRVVCDTNILISALLGSSTNRKVLEIFESGQITLLFSKETLSELAEVLRRPQLGIRISEIQSLFRAVQEKAEKIRIERMVWCCRDSKDDIVLNTAYF